MADAPPSSSQETFYEENKITLEKENVRSSPLRPQSSSGSILSSTIKERRNPTVTPKRFNKFFAPRNSLSTRGGRQSKAGRQLQDITRNAVNRRRSGLAVRDEFAAATPDINDLHSSRPFKRRKISPDLQSSPPQSSPLKHVQNADPIPILEDDLSDAETLPDLFQQLKPFPKPVRRLREAGTSRRILERTFGGYGALSRGRRGPDHAADVRAETANFVTTPKDVHGFRGTALPFCTATCNTNSLVAVGDEEGSVRLIDSSSSSKFEETHVKFRVHKNAVMDVTFSSDDYLLATASGDQTARVVDMATQQIMCILSGHKSSVKQVRFRPGDDNMVTTSARDGTVQLWDLRCGGKSAVQNFRASLGQRQDADGRLEPQVRYPQHEIEVGFGHRSQQRPFESGYVHELSITSFQHLPHGREHLILTASEVDASVKLWDLRNAGRRHPVPLSSSTPPASHRGSRHYGINSMALSGDGARVYTVCRDSVVYVYSTDSLALGQVPEMSATPGRRRMLKEPKEGLAPLYGFRNPALRLGTFYVKASLRPAKGDRGEMLAVGSTDRCPVLFPTDERYLPLLRGQHGEKHCDEEEDDVMDLPTVPTVPSQTPAIPTPAIFNHGTALLRAHNKEVTSLAWTTEGNLISVSDDFSARCWREDAAKARHLRQGGEFGGERWRCGWAEVEADFDEDDG